MNSRDYGFLNGTDTAKLMRPILRSSFPGVKFSVRAIKAAGSESVIVEWTEATGPALKSVQRVVEPFNKRSRHTIDGQELEAYATIACYPVPADIDMGPR